ncbi:MAG: hypothetical protein V6Z89_08845 [Desulfobacter sp.]
MISLKRIRTVLCFATLSLGLFACGPDASIEAEDVAIKVNNAVVTTEEFNELIKLEAYVDPEMNLSDESRRQYVEYLIRKELMIQEAMRMKLDRKASFIKTIEKYWESTLVRKLLDLKTEELRKKILITDDEMAAYYAENKDAFGQPYEAVKESIKQILESDRVQKKLEDWSRELQETAEITVNPSLSGK